MLKYEFVQDGEFGKPQYDVKFLFLNGIAESIGYLYFKGGYWNFSSLSVYGLPAHLMIEIGEKMEEFNESVRKQLFLGRF